MKKLSLYLIYVLLYGFAAAQSTQMDKATQAYLNHYVAYINANIHGLRQYHKRFEQFNLLANNYYAQAPFDKEGRIGYERNAKPLKFEAPSIFMDKTAFELLPDELYQKILYEPNRLPAQQLSTLWERAKEVEAIKTEIVRLGENLEEYCMSGGYYDDEGLEVAYKGISRAEILFHDFAESKDLLYYELKRINNGFIQPNVNNPYVRATSKLLTFILYARNCLVALKKEDQQTVREQLPLMQTAYIDLVDNQAKYLEGIKSQAFIDQYNMTGRKAEVYVKVAKDFLESPFIEPKYNAYGLEYYNYNNYFLSNYDRFGAGIVPEYNKLVDMSEVPLLKLPEEPNWLKALPQPYRADRPKKEEPKPVEPPKDSLPKPKPQPIPKPKPKPEPKPEPVVVKVDTPKVELPPVPIESKAIAGSAPVNFVFLLDVSGSMQAAYKLPLLKKSFRNLIELLRPSDRVSIVLYSGNAKVVLKPTLCLEKEKIIEAIEGVQSAGESDVVKGMKLALKAAQQSLLTDGNNRIILATDGGIGISPELLRIVQEGYQTQNIYTSVFYYEEKEYAGKAEKLRQLAQQGKGNYAYINAGNADAMLIQEVNSVRRK